MSDVLIKFYPPPKRAYYRTAPNAGEVSLKNIGEIIREGNNVKIIEKNKGDITHHVLFKILHAQERAAAEQGPLRIVDELTNIIKSGGLLAAARNCCPKKWAGNMATDDDV